MLGKSPTLLTVVLFQAGSVSVSDATYFGRVFMRSAMPVSSLIFGQESAKTS